MSAVEEVGTLLDATFAFLIRPSTVSGGELPNFFFHNMPDNSTVAEEAYVLSQYPGQSPQRNLRVGTIFEKPRLQLLGRGPKYKPVFDHMNEIKNFLNTQQDVMIGGVHYLDIYSVAEPGEIGSDTNNRQRATCNFQVVKEPS